GFRAHLGPDRGPGRLGPLEPARPGRGGRHRLRRPAAHDRGLAGPRRAARHGAGGRVAAAGPTGLGRKARLSIPHPALHRDRG
ncbi:hypothetical protein LTR94_037913, partial [Friedmanniomyces endolithicus]